MILGDMMLKSVEGGLCEMMSYMLDMLRGPNPKGVGNQVSRSELTRLDAVIRSRAFQLTSLETREEQSARAWGSSTILFHV